MSLLKQASGLSGVSTIGSEGEQLLVAEALRFMRAGGMLRLTDWTELDSEERAALVTANTELVSAEACARGWASQSPLQSAQIAADYDGGAMLEAVAFEVMRDRLKGQVA